MQILMKFLTSLVTFPGLLILAILLSQKIWKGGRHAPSIIIAAVLYLLSIPVASNLISTLEEIDAVYRGEPKADVIILLGGGGSFSAADLSGRGVPSPDAATRVIEAARLYRIYKKPVIASGGGTGRDETEAGIMKRFLVDLSVRGGDVMIEDESRDTAGNARNVKKIFDGKGFRRGILVTSAYHMRRAVFLFETEGIRVVPHSAGALADRKLPIGLAGFIPDANSLKESSVALRECVLLLYYRTVRAVASMRDRAR